MLEGRVEHKDSAGNQVRAVHSQKPRDKQQCLQGGHRSWGCPMDDSRPRHRPFRNAKEVRHRQMLGLPTVDQSTQKRQNDQTQAHLYRLSSPLCHSRFNSRYQDYQASDIPHYDRGGVHVRVLGGTSGDTSGPITFRNPGLLLDVALQPGSSFDQEVHASLLLPCLTCLPRFQISGMQWPMCVMGGVN